MSLAIFNATLFLAASLMNLKQAKAFITMILLCLSCNCLAVELSDKIEQALRGRIDRPFVAIILVAKGSDIIYQRVFGSFDNPSMESQFIIGSITKQFTATILMRLVDQGLINLDNPIKIYLPELPDTWAKIVTVRNLLNHTSGIDAVGKPLKFAPGTQARYSRTQTFALAAQIAERVSGKTYQQLLDEILTLAGVKAHLAISGNIPENRHIYKNLVRSFRESSSTSDIDKRIVEMKLAPYTKKEAPSSGLIISAKDLLSWQLALHNEKLVSAVSYKAMTTPYALMTHHVYPEMYSGIGMQIINDNGILELIHQGYSRFSGHLASMAYFPESKFSIITLENIVRNWRDPSRPFAEHDAIREIIRQHLASCD